MSHLGRGSRDQFNRGTESLLLDYPSDQLQRFRTAAWRRLAELGHVCRPTNGEWRVEPPTLSLLPGGGVWRGGRVQAWASRMEQAAHLLHCDVRSTAIFGAPPRLQVSGDLTALKALAEMTQAGIEDQAPLRLLAAFPAFAERLRTSPAALPPSDGVSDGFDYGTMNWTTSERAGAVRRYRHPKQGDRFFLEVEGGRHLHVTEPEAIHFGAALEGRSLCRYDEAAQRLTAAWSLPVEFSRPLCLCRGLPSESVGPGRVYPDVSRPVGLLLSRAIGGDQSRVRWF